MLGQGNGNRPLAELCADPSVKIVNLAFVTEFPKHVGDYPKTNFGE
jgi:chitinase